MSIDVRTELFAEFAAHYQALQAQILRLPFEMGMKDLMVKQFYIGFLIAEKAFSTLNLDALKPEQKTEDKPETPQE